MTPIDRILAKLQKVKQTGEHRWQACCPAHHDCNPSLSVTEGNDGRVLLHCFAGCSFEDICAALGLHLQDLFPGGGHGGTGAGQGRPTPVIRRVIPLGPRKPLRADLANLHTRYQADIDPDDLQRLANDLGLSVDNLGRLGIGWCGWGWSFPMKDAKGQIIGIRVRKRNGEKLCVSGSRQALFLPDGLNFTDFLLVAEGPTDCAALLDLGFNSIGRPSCSGGTDLIASLCKTHWPRSIVIAADTDEPGHKGARHLASRLRGYCTSITIVFPPLGFKDIRAWKKSGASREDVVQGIRQASLIKWNRS